MLTNKLCKSCEDGDIIGVEQLLESGASPNFASSGNGYRYPLHYAAYSGHVEIVKLLLQNEAAVDPLESSNAWTPLMLAALKSANSPQHVAVIMTLLKAGADIEITDARGNTIFHILASLGQTKLLKRLLELFPSLDILGPGFGYLTPLHYSTEAGHIDTVQFFLQRGADPRGIDASGWTPMHWACRRGCKRIIDSLLISGGSMYDRDFRSLTPLDIASLFGHVGLAKLLEAQMPRSCNMQLASQTEELALKKGTETFKSNIPDDPPLNDLCTEPQSQQCLYLPSEARHHQSCPPAWDYHTFVCWLAGIFIVALSVFDYASRVSMVALLSATARTVQGIGPTLVAVVTLACISVILPSIALGVCCGSHLKSTFSCAGWWVATAVHLFSDSSCGAGRGTVRQTPLSFGQLLAVEMFSRIRRLLIPSSMPLALRLAAAGVVLPPVAVACFFLLWVQIVVVAVGAALAVAAIWACSASGLVASKVLLVHRGALLHFLDCLTVGSALQLISSDRITQQNCDQNASTVPLPSSSRIAQSKPASNHGSQNEIQHGDIEPPHSEDFPSSPKVGQALRTIGEEAAESESVSIGCGEASSNNNCVLVLDNHSVSIKHPANSNVEDKSRLRTPRPVRESAFYTKATLAGSVPRLLHPCRYLRAAILLHGHYFEGFKDGHCLSNSTSRRRRVVDPKRSDSASSGLSGIVSAKKANSIKEPFESPCVEGGWRFHGSSGGLFANSLRRPVGVHDYDSLVICDQAKKKYWSSGLEAESVMNPHTTDCSSDGPASCGNAKCPLSSGLLAYTYNGSFQGLKPFHATIDEANDALASDHSHAHSVSSEIVSRRSDNTNSRMESFVPLPAGVSPFRWMRRQIKQLCDKPSYPQASPSFRTHATRVSRPGIPIVPTPGNGKLSCRAVSHSQVLCTLQATQSSRAGTLGLKLLFTGHPTQCETSTDSYECQTGPKEKHLKSRWGVQILKRRKQRPVAAQLDEAEYDDLILRREQRIFEWFERLVAFRYAEVKAIRETAAATLSESDSETLSYPCGEATAEALSCPPSRSSSAHDGQSGIKWSTFRTLFPDEAYAGQPQLDRIGDKSEFERPVGSEVISCIQTEDLFELPFNEALTPRSLMLCLGKRRQEQRSTWTGPSLFDCPELIDPNKAAEQDISTEGSSTRGDRTSDPLPIPTIHYRFKDMVEMPHLRDAFFRFWCREFEKLLLYQDQFFGSNPLWIGNVLEEDSVSAFSQGRLSSRSFTKPSTSSPDQFVTEKKDQSLNNCHGTELLWLVSQHSCKLKKECLLQSVGGEEMGCQGGSDKLEGCSGICFNQTPPDPPMTFAIAVNPGKLEPCTSLSVLSSQKQGPVCDLQGAGGPPPVHCSTLSGITSGSADISKATVTVGESEQSSDASGSRFVLVVEACRFMFVLALTLDLLLGLFPLMVALLFLYFLPHNFVPPIIDSATSEASSFSVDCANAALGPAAFPGGYLVSFQSMTAATAFCALRVAPFWSFFLALFVSFVQAALLFSRAARVFIPVKTDCMPNEHPWGFHRTCSAPVI